MVVKNSDGMFSRFGVQNLQT